METFTVMFMKVRFLIVVLTLGVAFLISCNNPGGSDSQSTPTSGLVVLQAAVSFTSSNPITAYLRSDFFIDGTFVVHLESSDSGTNGSDSVEYEIAMPIGTHSVASSGTYGTSQSGSAAFSKSAVQLSIAGGQTTVYRLLSTGGSTPAIQTSQY
jgi:hypothetical protein